MRNTGPSPETRDLVIERDRHMCALCGEPVRGQYSLQHRRARGMGGSRKPDTNSPSNLVLLDGSATTGCHQYVESHPVMAEEMGFRVPQWADPAKWAIDHAVLGAVYLEHDGTYTPVPTEPDEVSA